MSADVQAKNVRTVMFPLLILCFASVVTTISGLSMSRPAWNVGVMKPPIDTIRNNNGGGEYGIRQLSAGESKATVEAWQKSMGVMSGNYDIELYELLQILSKILNVMPGKMPQRHEYMLFGEFSDGVIECISAAYCGKVTCPWEMDVILIAQCPSFSDEKVGNMVEFIKTACLENACLPNFTPLCRYSNTLRIDKYVKGDLQNDDNDFELEVAMAYQAANQGACRVLCLSGVPEVYTFPYWYSISVPRPDSSIFIPLYFRQTINCMTDFQLSFIKPLTGTETGRGTVGGALILKEQNARKLKPLATADFFAAMRADIAKRIVHPDLTHIMAKAAAKRPWQAL